MPPAGAVGQVAGRAMPDGPGAMAAANVMPLTQPHRVPLAPALAARLVAFVQMVLLARHPRMTEQAAGGAAQVADNEIPYIKIHWNTSTPSPGGSCTRIGRAGTWKQCLG